VTPFMFAVQELLDGSHAPGYRTEPSHSESVAVAAHTQVQIRSLAEQLVCEANAILRAHGDAITLIDDSGTGELSFSLGYRDRTARVRTALSGRTALAQLLISGHFKDEQCRLTNEDELRALVLSLLDASPTARTTG